MCLKFLRLNQERKHLSLDSEVDFSILNFGKFQITVGSVLCKLLGSSEFVIIGNIFTCLISNFHSGDETKKSLDLGMRNIWRWI
jgi:hypothetical protein